EVFIETKPSVPSEDAAKVKAMIKNKDKDGLNTYFLELSDRRMRQNNVDGVYVLIIKAPGRIQVRSSKKIEASFDGNQRKELRDIMTTHFNKKDFDTGILDGVEYIRDQFAKNPPRAGAAPQVAKNPKTAPGVLKDEKGEWNWTGIICVGLVVLVVVWLIF